MLPAADRCGVAIALENLLADSVYSDMELLIEHVDHVGDARVGVCLDTGHANVLGYGLPDAVRKIGRRLLMLHVHDNDGGSDQHAAPFAGCIEWPGFAAALDEVGYGGTLNLEVVDRANGPPASDAFVRAALDAARRVLEMG